MTIRKTVGAVALFLFALSASALAGPLEDRLIEAARLGRVADVKALLKEGANPNARDKEGSTALMAAASGEIVRVLAAAGADVNAQTDEDIFGSRTALRNAALLNNADKVQALLDCGADVNAKNSHGETALTAAAVNGWAAVARILVARGADVNQATESGSTPLLQATERGHLEIVRLLVEKRADVTAKDESGKTALAIANELIRDGEYGPVRSNGKMVKEPLTPERRKAFEEIVKVLTAAGAK